MHEPLFGKLELNNNGFLEPEITDKFSSGEQNKIGLESGIQFNSDSDEDGDFDLNILSSCEIVKKNWVKLSDKEPSEIGKRGTTTTFTLPSKRKLNVRSNAFQYDFPQKSPGSESGERNKKLTFVDEVKPAKTGAVMGSQQVTTGMQNQGGGGHGQAGGGGLVQPGGASHGQGSASRQLLPGLLYIDDKGGKQQYKQTNGIQTNGKVATGAPAGNTQAATFAKELLNGGTSPTADALAKKTLVNPGVGSASLPANLPALPTSSQGVSPKEQLAYLSQDDNLEDAIILPDRKLSQSKDPGDIIKSSPNQPTNKAPKYHAGSTVKLFRPWETPQELHTRFQDSAAGNLKEGSNDIMVNNGTTELSSSTMVNHKTGDRIILRHSTGTSATTSRTMSPGRDQISKEVIQERSKQDCRTGCQKFLITNLPGCTEQNLNNLFSPFGKVKKIKINALLGTVGVIIFENKEGIEEALTAKPILLFGHRLEVSKMNNKNSQNQGHNADGLEERQRQTHQKRGINATMIKTTAKKLSRGHSSSMSRTESGGNENARATYVEDEEQDENGMTTDEPMESHIQDNLSHFEESQIQAEEPKTPPKKGKSNKVPKQPSNFECTDCSCKFKTFMKLKMHQETQHVPISCPVTGCNKKILKKRMDRHLNTHKQQKIPCSFPDCAVLFTRKDNLLAHIRNVHANESYQ